MFRENGIMGTREWGVEKKVLFGVKLVFWMKDFRKSRFSIEFQKEEKMNEHEDIILRKIRIPP